MLSPQVRIMRDIRNISFYSSEYWSVKQKGDSLLTWNGVITPHADSPYAGKTIEVDILFPDTYPLNPPTVRALTYINHPCISENGTIDIFGIEWTPAYSIGSIMIMLMILFNDYDHTKARQIERHNKFKEELFLKTQMENPVW